MKIEIVVPCINLWTKYTKPCLDSIQEAMIRAKAHDIDCHLLLIDNNSIDDTKEEASKMEGDLFHYHRSSNDEQWGFQRSVNFGACYAWDHGADYVLVCNNDIIIHPEAIWRLAERIDKGDVGMATCMDVRGDMQRDGVKPGDIGTLSAKDKEAVEEAPHPNFSAFMIGRAAWEIVGEFDEIFFPAYWEDNCYHYRLQLAEVSAICLPTAMFYHWGSRTQNEADIRGPIVPGPMFENNRAKYVKKWGGLPEHETFKNPYNDETKSIRSTQQTPGA